MSERGNDYTDVAGLPPLVAKAAQLARDIGFKNSCAVPYGRLLAVLAAQTYNGYIGETGTGCGVGIAWMLSGASAETRILSVEQNVDQVEAARALFADHRNVTILHGDALELRDHGPFDLLYADGGPGKRDHQDIAVSMVRPGGLILLDDLTPGESNDVRGWWLNSPSVRAIEITLSDDFAAILAVRR